MVMNTAAMLSGDYDAVERDIKAVVDIARKHSNRDKDAPYITVKVIFETCLLSDEYIVKACELAHNAGVDYVKTSTGFGSAGATLPHVKLMYNCVQEADRGIKVKSSGGVKTLDQLIDFMDAGATRCGCSATANILEDFLARASKGG